MDSNQQTQPQEDYPLRGRPEPGQRPNRTMAEKNMMPASGNRTETPEKEEMAQTRAPKKKGIGRKLLPFFLPMGGSIGGALGIFKLLS